MNIAVLGAGAMGCLFGGRLAETGNDVVLIDVDQGQITAINTDGLRLETTQGERTLRVPAGRAGDFDTAFDLIIVFTKATHTEEAIVGVGHLVGPETVILTVQNGLGNVEAIGRHVPVRQIVMGMTNFPADLIGPGHVSSHGSGSVRIWSVTGEDAEHLRVITRILNEAGLDCTADPLVEGAIWEKVAFNAALNSICAVTGRTVGGLGASDVGREIAWATAQETLAVARAKGIQVDPERVRRAIAHAFESHGNHAPSMLQDLQAGRRTEIENINGAVVSEGAARGIQTPITGTLLRLIRVMEAR